MKRRGSPALLALALALAACRAPSGGSAGTLSVADVRQPATSLYFLARQSGCLAAEGLAVEERTFELGRDALAEVSQGRAQVAIVYETPLLRAAFHDDRLRILTTLHTSTRNTRLVARRDRGVASFQDLARRRIGAARGTNADFFVDLALRLGGVPRAAVTVEDLPPEASVAALAAGTLDAAVLLDPFASEAERLLGEGARVLRTELYAEVSLLVTRADVVAAHEPALLALLRALACAERTLERDPEGSFAALRGRFPEQGEGALQAQLARVERGVGLDHVLLEVLRDELAWLQATAAPGGAPPDLHRLVEPRLLEAVRPEAVMLLVPAGGAR